MISRPTVGQPPMTWPTWMITKISTIGTTSKASATSHGMSLPLPAIHPSVTGRPAHRGRSSGGHLLAGLRGAGRRWRFGSVAGPTAAAVQQSQDDAEQAEAGQNP